MPSTQLSNKKHSAVLRASRHLRKNLYSEKPEKRKTKGLFFYVWSSDWSHHNTKSCAWAHFHDWLKCRDLTLTQNIYWLDGLSLPNCIRGFKIKEEAKSQRCYSRGDCHIRKKSKWMWILWYFHLAGDNPAQAHYKDHTWKTWKQ